MIGKWTGHMDRDEQGNISLWVADAWGWRVTFTATRDPRGGYILAGQLGDVPDVLRVPIVDDPVGKDG